MNFKIHMILMSDQEGFTTVCGIDDGCSDKFKDTAEFSNFGDSTKTTCKKCLRRYNAMLAAHDIEVQDEIMRIDRAGKAREEFCVWYYAQPQPLDANKVFDWFYPLLA